MIVVDASAILDLGLRNEPKASWLERCGLPEADLHAPHLLDVEIASGLRRLRYLSHQISERRALAVLELLESLSIERYPHVQLLGRIWQLPGLSAYDATYVALAEALDAPLITTDARLASSTGHRARIEAYSA